MAKLAFTVAVFLAGLWFTVTAAADLDLVTSRGQPGPGMVPVLAGAGIMVTTGYALARQVVLRRQGAAAPAPNRLTEEGYPVVESPRDALVSAGLVMLLVLALPLLGIWLSTVLYCAGSAFVLYRQRRLKVAALTLAVPLAVLLLFDIVLELDLPEGVFS